jgi:shikimate dehydrogenase
LDRPLDIILKENSRYADRPLVSSPEKLRAMEKERRTLYQAAADATLYNDVALEEAVEKLAGLLMAAAPLGKASARGYAVIGDPIAHTLSPRIHKTVFDALGIDEPYVAVRVPRGKLVDFTNPLKGAAPYGVTTHGVTASGGRVFDFCGAGFRGFNVTIPHKRDIIPLLDEVEEEARLCGAVNTVVVRDGKLWGFNTDMGGLLAALRESGNEYRDRRIVVLGAGGAARGIVFKAVREHAARVSVLGRRLEKAEELALEVGALSLCPVRSGDFSPESLGAAAAEADILINATPLGMSGIGDCFPSLEFLRRLPDSAIVCDIVYNPPLTSFLRTARDWGHAVQNGLGMLIYQALLADELFLGRALDKPVLYAKINEVLQQNIE